MPQAKTTGSRLTPRSPKSATTRKSTTTSVAKRRETPAKPYESKIRQKVEPPFEPKRHLDREKTPEQELNDVMGWTEPVQPLELTVGYNGRQVAVAVVLTASIVANIALVIAAVVRH